MSEILRFTVAEVAPERAVVLKHQGISADRVVTARIEALCTAALGVCSEVANPVGILKEITKAEFESVYKGEGRNEPSTPVDGIFKRADRLALFAVTLGPRIGREIAARFESNDLALGCMLDSVASVATDGLAELVERRYGELLAEASEVSSDTRVLRYSPGYCGWHVSGQRKLFEFLGPGEIGIALRDSFLMDPLKSVSGVILAGPKEIHDFDIGYSFCAPCETRECRERISALDAL